MSKGTQITPEENAKALAAIETAISGGLTEKKLADRIGVSQQAVNQWRRKERKVGRKYYEILVSGDAPSDSGDPLEQVLAIDWWDADHVPSPRVCAEVLREARQERDALDEAFTKVYWVAYLRRRAGELAAHKALDAAGADAPKRRTKSRRGLR